MKRVVERGVWRLTARVGFDNKGERINGLDLVCGLVNYIIYAISLPSFKISS